MHNLKPLITQSDKFRLCVVIVNEEMMYRNHNYIVQSYKHAHSCCQCLHQHISSIKVLLV